MGSCCRRWASRWCTICRGSGKACRITSADPLQHPSIQPNYLSTELDRRVAVAGIKVARRIAATPSLAPQITEEFVPGVHYQSDDELLEAARLFSQTIYHPTSTCRMGRDDLAVVDARLRVHGTEGLRVVDASVMPEIISGNTNAPTIMIAEKAADMILEDARRTTAMAAAGKEPSPRQGAAVEA